jgi:hypothetical protein
MEEPTRADDGPAPQLAVHGTGPAAITLGGLTAGGAALLVFVSEHCPTSALALRRLGPLCPAWARAGLTAIAIFEDPLDVAIRTARRLGWAGQVAAQEPPYPASQAYRLATVPTATWPRRCPRWTAATTSRRCSSAAGPTACR